jgi:hypothetical protein
MRVSGNLLPVRNPLNEQTEKNREWNKYGKRQKERYSKETHGLKKKTNTENEFSFCWITC